MTDARQGEPGVSAYREKELEQAARLQFRVDPEYGKDEIHDLQQGCIVQREVRNESLNHKKNQRYQHYPKLGGLKNHHH